MAWSAGAVLTAAQLNAYAPQEWTNYSPSLSGITAATVTGRYIKIGKTVHYRIVLTFTGGALGTVLMGLPVTVSPSVGSGATVGIGSAVGLRQTVGNYYGTAYAASTSQVGVEGPGVAQTWNASTPATWAATDVWNIHGTYEAA